MSFALDISKFVAKAKLDAPKVIRKIAMEAFRGVVLKTPVRTGRARANWGVSVGKPKAPSSSLAVDKSGSVTLAAIQDGVEDFAGDGSIFLTNNLPYIGPLEHGSSKQAPLGMVKLTVHEMRLHYGGVKK